MPHHQFQLETYSGPGMIPEGAIVEYRHGKLEAVSSRYYLGRPVHPLTISPTEAAKRILEDNLALGIRRYQYLETVAGSDAIALAPTATQPQARHGLNADTPVITAGQLAAMLNSVPPDLPVAVGDLYGANAATLLTDKLIPSPVEIDRIDANAKPGQLAATGKDEATDCVIIRAHVVDATDQTQFQGTENAGTLYHFDSLASRIITEAAFARATAPRGDAPPPIYGNDLLHARTVTIGNPDIDPAGIALLLADGSSLLQYRFKAPADADTDRQNLARLDRDADLDAKRLWIDYSYQPAVASHRIPPTPYLKPPRSALSRQTAQAPAKADS